MTTLAGLLIMGAALGSLWLLRDPTEKDCECGQERTFLGYDKAGRPMYDEPCCEPDYDPARGGYVHADSCKGDQ
jgi:hypothetical protein